MKGRRIKKVHNEAVAGDIFDLRPQRVNDDPIFYTKLKYRAHERGKEREFRFICTSIQPRDISGTALARHRYFVRISDQSEIAAMRILQVSNSAAALSSIRRRADELADV